MKPEEQRIAIAKHRGWSEPLRNSLGGPNCYIPKYTEDLNAIRDAVMGLPQDIMDKYWMHLSEIVTGFTWSEFDSSNKYSCADVSNATAAQRAEAYLRTTGKWEEEE